MKTTVKMALMVWLATGTAFCANKAQTADFTVNVYVAQQAATPGGLLVLAEASATRVLAPAGVKLVWHRGAAAADAGPDVLQIEFIPTAPAAYDVKENQNALAAARPYASDGMQILVFQDRVSNYIAPFHSHAPVVLGHILAHEISHMLEGVARHSDTGLMRAVWTANDLSAMICDGLALAPVDRDMIREVLTQRLNHTGDQTY